MLAFNGFDGIRDGRSKKIKESGMNERIGIAFGFTPGTALTVSSFKLRVVGRGCNASL